ncbi:TraI domain-containing protein [Entomomonas sp. E2T0]|uniref:MobH family relaxase n=1 Tax=Entomomonas sp. E2T0 TaxID=2930213 RepID=UPI0022284DC4|nr:MobH family relaxase [Entomomonas sp. E2T0]UYZ83039.1 TraI domain-containing protein [Entomomonas sp. E2T0]
MLKKLLGKIGINVGKSFTAEPHTLSEGYLLPQSADQLLATELRQALINHIWQHTSLSRDNFQKIYVNPIEKYAALVQQFPASETHHHAYLGGLLDHGLELVGHALKLRQSYLLPPGAAPEDQAVQGDAWTAAIAYGGLLHDIGKIAVDIEVQLQDGSQWHPWLGAIKQPYRFRYLQNRDYHLHDMAVGLLCHHIIDTDMLNWLCSYQELWSNFLNLVAGNYENAGLLGEIVDKADRVSTAKNIGANPEKAIAAPVNSLQKKLITGLKQLIKTQFNINKTPGNGWLTQDGLWLMSKTTADSLRAYLLSQGFDGIPSKNSILFDELQSYQIIQANPVDDRAIWTVAVSDETGKWQQEFSLIKVNPSLIWASDEKPELFKGQIEVIQKEETNPTTTKAVNKTVTNKKVADNFNFDELANITNTVNVASPSPTPLNLSKTNADDDTDDILSLFDMDTNEVVAENTLTVSIDNQSIEEPSIEVSLFDSNFDGNNATEVVDACVDLYLNDNSTAALDSSNLVFNLDEPLTKTSLGEMFIQWLKQRISTHKLKINDADAKVHIIQDKLFIVSPSIFQRFSFEYPELAKVIDNNKKEPWKVIQSSFERLKIHIKREDDLNIWQCSVIGPRKKGQIIKGYLLKTSLVFTEFTPNNNPFLELITEA